MLILLKSTIAIPYHYNYNRTLKSTVQQPAKEPAKKQTLATNTGSNMKPPSMKIKFHIIIEVIYFSSHEAFCITAQLIYFHSKKQVF